MSNTLNTNAQDMFASDFRVYIEGVQVPFESVHISNIYKQPPSASITMPPWPGLQDLGRNYTPKVDVFWRDCNYGVSVAELAELKDDARDAQRDAYKVIFSGVIVSTVDSKSVSSDSGSQDLTLNCKHPIMALNDILIRFGNQALTAAQNQIDPNADSTLQKAEWDIHTLMIKALMGVKEGGSPGDLDYVPEGKFEELQGTPGMLYVMWNSLKSDAVRRQGGKGSSQVLKDIYIPLIDKGLKFWERMTGHPGIESGVQGPRIKYNDGTNGSAIYGMDPDLSGDIMIPSSFRSFLGEAAQKQFAIAATQSLAAGVGSAEASSFGDHLDALLQRLEYEMVILSSPVSVGPEGTRAYEYLIKPETPTYYAPICNVILPNLLSSVVVNNDYSAVPSRTVNLSNIVSQVTGGRTGGVPDQQYTSPHSVRYARAGGAKGHLGKSLSAFNNVAGKYEYGSGVRVKTTQIPSLYNLMRVNLEAIEAEEGLDTTVVGAKSHALSMSAWSIMNPDSKWPGAAKYNPLSLDSEISSFNRLNFMYSDQQFALETNRARTAQASGVFNPYPIIGYPMDFVDSVPSRESYHGFCTSVSHTIHASGSSTTNYGMSGVSTISELALYNLPPVNPYLSAVFELDEDFRIFKNRKAYVKACEIYRGVLGIGAAEPALLQDYHTGSTTSFSRDPASGCWTDKDSTDDTDTAFKDTVQGSMMLVARNIRSLKEMEDERKEDGLSVYVDIADWQAATPDDVVAADKVTRVEVSEDGVKILTPGRDAESSPFLTYTRQRPL